jgi:hypothetical protein
MLLACKVFASRQAIAIGPTPSGTGVIVLASVDLTGRQGPRNHGLLDPTGRNGVL